MALPIILQVATDSLISHTAGLRLGETIYRVKVDRLKYSPSRRMSTEIGMPVCTRVDIDDPWVLAAFKLPQIHQLALDFLYQNCSVVWEKHITVNANLSRLNLLHMKNWSNDGDLPLLLNSLPLLEILIITTWIEVDFFKAFLPMDENVTPGLKQTSGEGKTSAVLCPRLRHLQIETQGLRTQPDLVHLYKDIVTLRAECGSPLEVFSIFEFRPEPGCKFELIGRDGSFTMEQSDLSKETEEFKLGI